MSTIILVIKDIYTKKKHDLIDMLFNFIEMSTIILVIKDIYTKKA